MNKTLIKFAGIFLATAVAMPLSAQNSKLEIIGEAPKFKTNNPGLIPYITELNNNIEKAFEDARKEINKEIDGINIMPEKFVRAWGDASVFSSDGANHRAYAGYDRFAFTIGPAVGLAVPSNFWDYVKDTDKAADKILDDMQKEGDLRFGLNPQIISAQAGINASRIFSPLPDGLYLGLRLGFMKLDDFIIDGFSFNNFSLGVTANYQLIEHKRLLPGGLVLWRGVNLGAGFIYQGTNIKLNMSLDKQALDIGESLPVPSDIPVIGGSKLRAEGSIDPSLYFDMDIKTIAIPLEASTSLRLLYFLNIPFGVGVDLGFGNSKLGLGARADVDVNVNATGLPEGLIESESPGSLSLDAGGKMSPSFFNFKLMSGLGLSLGPVVLDIPVTYYPANHGFSVGVSIGVVW
jgi:hypothetical protein